METLECHKLANTCLSALVTFRCTHLKLASLTFHVRFDSACRCRFHTQTFWGRVSKSFANEICIGTQNQDEFGQSFVHRAAYNTLNHVVIN